MNLYIITFVDENGLVWYLSRHAICAWSQLGEYNESYFHTETEVKIRQEQFKNVDKDNFDFWPQKVKLVGTIKYEDGKVRLVEPSKFVPVQREFEFFSFA